METHEIEGHMEVVERRLKTAAEKVDELPIMVRGQVKEVMAPLILSMQSIAHAMKAVSREL